MWYKWNDVMETPPMSDLVENIVFWIMVGAVTLCIAAFIIHLAQVNGGGKDEG